MYVKLWKPLGSRLVGLILLPLTLSIILIIIIIYWVKGERKPFFSQTRIGYQARPFNLVKFRTLSADLSKSDQERSTTLGKKLRYLHLDEIPQLLHLITGKMCLFGPRPLLPSYLSVYTPKEDSRHSVYPGLLGLAQAKGGNSLNWNHRLRYDAFYAAHCSIMLDLKILKWVFLGLSGLGKRRASTHSYSSSLLTERSNPGTSTSATVVD